MTYTDFKFYKNAQDTTTGFEGEVRVYPGWHYDSVAGKYATIGPVQVSR